MKWFAAFLFLLIAFPADAATCFWVGGTGTWNNSTDTANWKSSTGGGVACAATGGVPKNAGDIATFDGASGGGTVTNNVDINIAQITMGAFTGTLDFATNNKNVTLTTAFSGTGAGTRTLNLGNGLWTLSNTASAVAWDMTTTTGLTFNANSSTVALTGALSGTTTKSFVGGGLTYSTVTMAGAGGGVVSITGANTFGTLTVTGALGISLGATQVVTTLNLNGTSGNAVYLTSSSISTQRTLTVTTLVAAWAAFRSISGSGTATNSFDLGNNSGITITAPVTGGGGRIIGG